MRLVEAGLSTLAQDYVKVLAEYVMGSVTGGTMVEQDTVPGWVHYTADLAEKLKYLVSKVVMIFNSNQGDMIINHQSFLASCLISQLLSNQKLQLSLTQQK